VESNTPEINGERRGLLQMLFVEGNHFCPSCEKSGNCELQALATNTRCSPALPPLLPRPPGGRLPPRRAARLQPLHLLRAVRARQPRVDGKSVFALTGRGIGKHLVVNAESGRLADTDFSKDDRPPTSARWA
jgi:[NiFe] hydrogenase diaphorase moiety small subunit